MAAADSGTNQTPFLTLPPRAGKEDEMKTLINCPDQFMSLILLLMGTSDKYYTIIETFLAELNKERPVALNELVIKIEITDRCGQFIHITKKE